MRGLLGLIEHHAPPASRMEDERGVLIQENQELCSKDSAQAISPKDTTKLASADNEPQKVKVDSWKTLNYQGYLGLKDRYIPL